MQNKKTVNIFINLLIFLFITIFFLNNILKVFSNEIIKYNIDENVDISISVLYNEKTSQDIYVDSINLSINQNIRKILSIMVLTKKILNFNILDNNIESIKSIEGLEYNNIPNKRQWYFYLNEIEIDSVNESISIKKDDKIYIKYISIEDESSSSSSSSNIESSSILDDDDISLPESSNSYIEEELEESYPSSLSSYYNEYKYSYKENNNSQWTMDISNIFLTSLSWIENRSSLNIDDILAIAISGGNLKHRDISRITNIIIEKNGKYISLIDLAKDILFVTFTGGNPYNINEINLIDTIYNFEDINVDGTEGLLYFLIAIHSGNYINSEDNSNDIIFHIMELIKQSEEFLDSDKFLYDSLLDNMEKLSLFSIALNKHTDDILINKFLINIYKFLYSNSYKIMSMSNKNQNSIIISNMIISVISLETNLKILDSDKINKFQLVNYLTDNFYTNKGFSYLRKQNIDKFSTIMAIKSLSSFKNNSNLYILKANINNNNDNIIYKKNGLYINIHFLNSLLIIMFIFIYIYIFIKKKYIKVI
ncbi:MAG: hypothetical protein KFW09_04140 [Oscillospiraceae bacterium]|nr:hypothetical protein [Oscillospiraceae bacterium]